MNARDAILRAVRAAQSTGTLPETTVTESLPQVALTTDALLARFLLEATALTVECFTEDTESAVRARLAALVRGCRVLSWSHEHLPYGAAAVLADSMSGATPLEEQALADVGVTACDAAVAETGSLVLLSAPGRSRTVSLLPPVHVAIVERHKLCFSMADVFHLHGARMASSASCTFITGPSRTADIELTLTLGIHGPGRVVVVVGP